MKKVLYISNISVPYRSMFFEKLAAYCNLTVLYERRKSSNRDESWSNINAKSYNIAYLDGKSIGRENSWSFRILKYLNKNFDVIIIGCYNSLVEILAMFSMRLCRKKYILNIDGEIFEPHNLFKRKIRDFVISGAPGYCCAGEKAVRHVNSITKNNNILPYYFSSMTQSEIYEAAGNNIIRNNIILAIGQFEPYKGLDLLIDVAELLPCYSFRIVGVGKRYGKIYKIICDKHLKNVEIIPFMKKEELKKEYDEDKMLVLPSRQECWGLVINEGAAHGIPIVSTWGSGAAVEFLSDKYNEFLAKNNNVEDLKDKIMKLYNSSNEKTQSYSEYLKKKAADYSIEKMVSSHLRLIDG